ncbi:MAG: DUF3551 domain-containing protein [Xanthobacteraceae bacterium]|jgi:hypothetical protein
MRRFLFGLGLLAAIVASANQAVAQNYPWCAQYSGNFGGTMNCGFVSFDQCMMTVRGMGGFCIVNNRYQPAAPAVARHPAQKRHVHDNS